jgi:hypothetical protein
MKKINFIGGISPEMAELLENNNIETIVNEDMTISISDEEYERLLKVAPFADIEIVK